MKIKGLFSGWANIKEFLHFPYTKIIIIKIMCRNYGESKMLKQVKSQIKENL